MNSFTDDTDPHYEKNEEKKYNAILSHGVVLCVLSG